MSRTFRRYVYFIGRYLIPAVRHQGPQSGMVLPELCPLSVTMDITVKTARQAPGRVCRTGRRAGELAYGTPAASGYYWSGAALALKA